MHFPHQGSTSGGPSVGTPETMGGISHSDHPSDQLCTLILVATFLQSHYLYNHWWASETWPLWHPAKCTLSTLPDDFLSYVVLLTHIHLASKPYTSTLPGRKTNCAASGLLPGLHQHHSCQASRSQDLKEWLISSSLSESENNFSVAASCFLFGRLNRDALSIWSQSPSSH